MLTFSLHAGIAMLAIAIVLNLYRLVKGPDVVDRIIALDTMYVNAAALIILYGLVTGGQIYYEAALVIAMLGFLSTTAFAKFLTRGDIIE